MKWADNRRRPRMFTTFKPARNGGHHNPERWNRMIAEPENLYHCIYDRRQPRPQPKTMPWIVGAVIWLWLALEGEL